jgi:maltokinase
MTDDHRGAGTGAGTGAIDLVALEPAFLEPVLRTYLARQPWFEGDEEAARLSSRDILWRRAGELGPALVWALVEVAGPRYQALLGVSHETAGRRCGERDAALLGPLAGGYLAYDALADPELSLALLEVVSGGRERATLVRQVVGGERSRMTCLAYDDRVMVKLYRRLQADPGPEPDVEVTEALDRVGFNHLPAPMAYWRREGRDLAMAQEFLVGGTEGWSLALTSLRDLYAGAAAPAEEPPPTPEAVAGAGGDFGAEARRLGEMTARLHLALAAAFGVEPGRAADWAERARAGLARLAGKGGLPRATDLDGARSALDRMAGLEDPGVAIRPHGDYHLGQVMRTAMGWFVLDFEGAPEHLAGGPPARCSPVWDVVGMLHSFRYAAAEARRERGPEESASVADLARAWEQRNRAAFLQGYLSTPDIAALLPPRQASFEAVLAAHSLEQAALELDAPGAADRAVVAGEELERLSGGDGGLSVP